MKAKRVDEIKRLIEPCRETDKCELEAENVAAMSEEEVAGLLAFYQEANDSLLECEEPAIDGEDQWPKVDLLDEWPEPDESEQTEDEEPEEADRQDGAEC